MKRQKKTQSLPRPIEHKPILPKLSFDIWWAIYSSKRNLSQELKESVKKHFKARGFWDSQEWDVGAKDFGF